MNMNEAILRNPAPSNGYPNPFRPNIPAQRNSGVPGQIEIHNRVDQQQTNPTSSYAIQCMRWKDCHQQHLKPGDYLFVCKKNNHTYTRKGRQPVKCLNLQQLNSLIATNSDVLKNPSDWAFYGVMHNDMMLNGGAALHKPHADRILNVDVRGRSVRVANLWPNSQPGDRVGFRLDSKWPGDDESDELQYIPKEMKVKFYMADADGKLRKEYETAEIRRLQAAIEELSDDQKAEKYRAETELRAEIKKVGNGDYPSGRSPQLYWPVNFSRLGGQEASDIYVGVISMTFKEPLRSDTRETCTRAMTQLDPRFQLPMCELFIRVH